MINNDVELDINSGKKAKFSGNPNSVYSQMNIANQKSNQEIQIFTDGSRCKLDDGDSSNTIVGSAFWIPKINHVSRFKLSPELSSFAAEAFAILKALFFIKQNNITFSVICSDSLSCLQALRSSDYQK